MRKTRNDMNAREWRNRLFAILTTCGVFACGGTSRVTSPQAPEAPTAPGDAPTPSGGCVTLATCTEECNERKADACASLARGYLQGWNDIAKDHTKVVRFGTLGCELGSADACDTLGFVYYDGRAGVQKAPDKALQYFERACAIGRRSQANWARSACYHAAKMYRNGEGTGSPDAGRAHELVAWLAADWTSDCEKVDGISGYFDCGYLAKMYEDGMGVAVDVERVAALNRRGADWAERVCHRRSQGDAYVSWHCGEAARIYTEGQTGVPRMPPRAASLWEIACDEVKTRDGETNFSSDACYHLGLMYSSGDGVVQDATKAASLFKKACSARESPSDKACQALSELLSGQQAAPSPPQRGGPVTTAEPRPPSGTSGALVDGAPQRNAHALIVAVERYRDLPPATGARVDAERWLAVARQTLGIPDERIRRILDDRATRSDIEAQLAWLKKNVKRDERVYFFFSGHGAPNPSTGAAYLVPYDGDAQSIQTTAIRLDVITQQLSDLRGKEVIGFVDSCFSGAGGRSVLPPGTRPLVRVQQAQTAPSVLLFTAASGGQISGEAKAGGGLFSFLVSEAIGKGLADVDGNGQINMAEVAQWVTPRVERAAQSDNREQTPSLLVGSQVGRADNVVVAWGLPLR